VTLITLIAVGCIYFLFGILNYLVYSDTALNLAPLITNALNECSVAVDVIVIIYLFSIMISYILNIYPSNQIIESYIYKNLPEGKWKFWLTNLTRTLLVAVTVGVGIGLESGIGKLVSILGSLFATPMAFVFPCGFHLKLIATKLWQKILNIVIMILGCIYIVFGTAYTIYTWNDS